MDFQLEEKGQLVTILLAGELDMSVSEQLGQLVRTQGRQHERIDIDFAAVSFVDSAGIGSIFFAAKELLANGKQVEIINIQEEIYDILQVLGFGEALGLTLRKAN
ncbi:STAS domain-containing protein [Brevibacillus fulvus]|uniref:Anti-anti-sigma factor n=1 Tax=Brevibacillus fulvus TaxID=1125967 RepID=A0A938XT86_9BACL|nr:STAS domain-containing protein [Brevibacillus fulvus]MBM7590033.1 anti-anti-sigma factor [Brevibacillus fulvus]